MGDMLSLQPLLALESATHIWLGVLGTLAACCFVGVVAMAMWSVGRETRFRQQTELLQSQAGEYLRGSRETISTLSHIAKAIESVEIGNRERLRELRELVGHALERMEQRMMWLSQSLDRGRGDRPGPVVQVGDRFDFDQVNGDAGRIDKRRTQHDDQNT